MNDPQPIEHKLYIDHDIGCGCILALVVITVPAFIIACIIIHHFAL